MPRPEPTLKRTTVMLPEDLRRRAFRKARERGVSLGLLIRESLDAAVPRTPPRRSEDPLFGDAAVYAGAAPKDLAIGHDRYLYGEGE